MLLKGKNLITEDNTLYTDIQHLIINGVEQNKKYQVLFNNRTYDSNISNQNIIFEIPEILDTNIISLKVYDVKGNFYILLIQ